MLERYLNTYFIALPDPVGVPHNVALHFVYDERQSPYLATGTINEPVDKLLLRVGSRLDVALSFTHVPAAPADFQIRAAAAMAAMSLYHGESEELGHVDPRDVLGEGAFKAGRLVTIAQVAVFDESSSSDMPKEIEIEDLSDPFLRSLHCVSHFVGAYNLSAPTPVRVPTYNRVGPSIPMLRRLLTIECPGQTIHLQPLNHKNYGDDKRPEVVDMSTLAQVMQNVQLLSAGDVRALYRRAIVEAQQLCIVEGDFATSIVKTAQACEILLDGIMGLMLWEEVGGAPLSDGQIDRAADILAVALMTRVRREYHPRLGGNWDPSDTGPIGDWARRVAAPRNRVVHQGYEPPADEASNALEAADALDHFVTERIAVKARQFPRTALMWVTEEGLNELGKWPLVRAFAQKRRHEEPPWRDGYVAWRGRVDGEIATGRRRARAPSKAE